MRNLVESVQEVLIEATSGEIKKWFAKQGVKGIRMKKVAVKNPFIKTFGAEIPNEIVKKAIIIFYGKVPSGVKDVDDIHYGNFSKRGLSLSLDHWDELIKTNMEMVEAKKIKLPPHLAKFFDKSGELKPEIQKRLKKNRGKKGFTITDVTPKGYGPK